MTAAHDEMRGAGGGGKGKRHGKRGAAGPRGVVGGGRVTRDVLVNRLGGEALTGFIFDIIDPDRKCTFQVGVYVCCRSLPSSL